MNSGSPLSFPVCSNKIKAGRFIEILWAIIANSALCALLAIYHLIYLMRPRGIIVKVAEWIFGTDKILFLLSFCVVISYYFY